MKSVDTKKYLRILLPLLFAVMLNGCEDQSHKGNEMADAKYNRLINEKSPYLLQHAENPVDWYPWGEEAFRAAREQDKPIFLSIGYSTCHWCHVMAHESFEDDSVAALMNQAFINIKVDREERPDVDDIYMTVCQMLTRHGGWPLTIIMTPDKKPFFAATYIPKMSRFNNYGMLDLIPRIQAAWKQDRSKILASAEEIHDALTQSAAGAPGAELAPNLPETAYEQLSERYDDELGGFGEKPKFPTAHNLMFLLRYYQRTRDHHVLEMVEHTLRQMRRGGIYDHVGYGFHRYATDREWLLPHFEKMLYDQAIMALAYSEAFQVTGNSRYRETAEQVLAYVLRDMTDPQGGFYSAEDADSEGEEGKFYVWRTDEIREILDASAAELFIQAYNLSDEGNFLEEATRQQTGANIPHLRASLETIAGEMELAPEVLADRLEAARQQLFAVREQRIHPLKDDKILSDWNGLMIAAFAKAAQAFDHPDYAAAAGKAADFVLAELRGDNGRLRHRYREGEVAGDGYLDDYAFMIWGLIELYETVFDVKYLQAALELNEVLLKHFWDAENGGFFFTADDGEALLVRKKEVYDGATPSGNSVMMLNLLRLGRLCGKPEFEAKAAQIGSAFAGNVMQYPSGYTLLMCALDFAAGPGREIVIAGEPGAEDTRALVRAVHQTFLPGRVLLLRPAGAAEPEIARLAPYAAAMTAIDGRAAAYVCRNYACELPVVEVGELKELLGK